MPVVETLNPIELQQRGPEIVLEVMSPRITGRGQAARFLAHGVQEVIIVELDGRIAFISEAGEGGLSRFGVRLALPPNTYPVTRLRLSARRATG